MDRLSFTVPGEPKGKGRPRFTKQGHAYTPAKTRSYEAAVATLAKAAMKGHPPFLGACSVAVVAYMSIPKSWSKIGQLRARQGFVHPTKKPDADNVVKCLDALNGIVWHDDAQAVDVLVRKRYSDNPRLEVSIVHLEAKDRGVAIIKTEAA